MRYNNNKLFRESKIRTVLRVVPPLRRNAALLCVRPELAAARTTVRPFALPVVRGRQQLAHRRCERGAAAATYSVLATKTAHG